MPACIARSLGVLRGLTVPADIVADRYLARSSSGLGHHPLKVAARVRIPYGLPRKVPGQSHSSEWLSWFSGLVATLMPRVLIVVLTVILQWGDRDQRSNTSPDTARPNDRWGARLPSGLRLVHGSSVRSPRCDRTTVKCRRSRVAMSRMPSRSAVAITEASVVPSGRSR